MSESYGGGPAGTPDAGTPGPAERIGTARDEAGGLASTAAEETGSVLETAKTEATGVAREAKAQVKDLYAQTRSELTEQAAAQQERVAAGLHSVGDELRSMADAAEDPGVAADVVRQVSNRVSAAAEWIGDRDPGSLLREVKSYARRKPGTFIAIAALAGLAVGRLSRALAETARGGSAESTPLYDRARSAPADAATTGGTGDVRPDAV